MQLTRNMKFTILFATVFMLTSLMPLHAADERPAKPNIIFILADDLGVGSVSCYGADHFKTPNIDKLAASGIRFTHCYLCKSRLWL